MARMYPAFIDPETTSPAEGRFFAALAGALGDEWVVFHHVCWIGYDSHQRPCDGEADFVVAHPDLGVLVIEVKGGGIRFDETTGHYVSTDRHGREHDIGDPFDQATRSKHTLIDKARSMPGWPRRWVVFGHAVAFPDQVVEVDWLRPNAPRSIIVDARDLDAPETRLREALAFWRGSDDRASSLGDEGIDVLIRLLGRAREIRHPLVAEQARRDETALIHLTEQQYRYLHFLSGRRRAAISGCAGSGKTLLAVEKARRLADEGLKVLLTCFNRPLAEHLRDVLGYGRFFDVFNFHHLCHHLGQQAGLPVEYEGPGAPSDEYFDRLPSILLEAIGQLGPQYDAIIVDEAQDFEAEWWELLLWLLHDPDNGILYVFYDDNQALYTKHSPIPVDDPPYMLGQNCRNTRRIFEAVSRFYESQTQPEVLGPEGQPVEVIDYAGERAGEAALRKVLHRLLHEHHFKPEEIAVLTARGAQTSRILGKRLGNVQLTDQLSPQAGEVLATTIRRFKGLERPVVVLCEIDETLKPGRINSLMYVGASRAKAYLVVLVDEKAPPNVRAAFIRSQ